MASRGAAAFAVVMVLTASRADARQPAPATDDQVSTGVLVGLGEPGHLATGRASFPVWSRSDVDIDVGGFGWSEPGNSSAFVSVQFRLLPRSRTQLRHLRGFVVGVNVARGGPAPAVGYSIDVVARPRFRVGIEGTTGGTPRAGPRVFAKLYVLWRR